MQIIPVIGLPVAAVDYRSAVTWILNRATAQDRVYAVAAANAHLAALARRDRSFRAVMSEFDFICPDGMPLVWAMNTQLNPEDRLRDRVYGPNLMLSTLQACHESGSAVRHFFLGGTDATLSALRLRYEREFPNLKICGMHSPRFGTWTESELSEMVEMIRLAKPHLIWIGLGCPKQEQWIARLKHQLPHGVYLAVGAAFAFHAGEVTQAPSVMQQYGLEWLFRLAMEPRRLFRRYFIYNTWFVFYVLTDCFKKRLLGSL